MNILEILTPLDLFAMFAPEPTDRDYDHYAQQDIQRARFDQSFICRSREQIRAEFKFKHAGAMLKESEKYNPRDETENKKLLANFRFVKA